MLRRTTLFIVCVAAIGACGDPPLDSDGLAFNPGAVGGADGQGSVGDVSDSTGSDSATVSDGATVSDTKTDPNAALDADHGQDAGEDAGAGGVPDGSAVDASVSGVDSGANTPDAGGPVDSGAANPCSSCPWDKQPTGNHPATKGTTSLLEPNKIAYKTGFGNGDKEMRVWVPLAAGTKPVLFFVHGFNLHTTGGFGQSDLGNAYIKLLEHVASRGYIVAFVRVQSGVTDCDHKAMAQKLVDASAVLLDKVSTADGTKVVFAGHSIGAKVALLAARRTINQDPKNEWPDPTAVLLFNLDNSKPTVCFSAFENAKAAASELLADAKVRVTFVHTEDDKISPYKDKTNGALAVYEALKLKWRQFIVLHGTGNGDPNAVTKPELHDDHAGPLTVEGNVGGIADFGLPPSHLDALDWYGYWKILVGAMDFHFKQGDATWAYGAMRVHGGVQGAKIIKHQVLKQGW
jgi:hypothetical protein